MVPSGATGRMNAAFAVRFPPPVFFFDPFAAFLAVFFAMCAPSASTRCARRDCRADTRAATAGEDGRVRLSPEARLRRGRNNAMPADQMMSERGGDGSNEHREEHAVP